MGRLLSFFTIISMVILLSGCTCFTGGNPTPIPPTATQHPTFDLIDKTGPAPSISPAPTDPVKPWVYRDVDVDLMRTDPVTIAVKIVSGADAGALKAIYLYIDSQYYVDHPETAIEFPAPVDTVLYYSVTHDKAHVIVIGDFDDGYAVLHEAWDI
jgi:hypothetical protein